MEGLINGFFKDAKDLLSRLEASVAERNYSAFSDHIHALKGCSGSIGALELYVRCKEIRSDAPTNTDYVSVLRSLNKIYKQTEDALSHYLSSQYAVKA
jgi:HPt (histidine-containing phosphotransfer) domain-containing protein